MSNSISEYRNLVITFDDAVSLPQLIAPIDSYKAAIGLVSDIEDRYAKLGAAVLDLTNATVLVTGNLPFQIHVFVLTTVLATGFYEFTYVETKPNTEA